MGKINIYKKKGLGFFPITVKIGDNKFQLDSGKLKEINIPNGKYDLIVKGLFGNEGRDKIEVNDNISTIEIKVVLTTEISVIGISVLLLIFILTYIGLISTISFWIFILICNIFLIIHNIVNRKKYFKFQLD